MTNVLDSLGLEGSILDGLDDWPGSATRKERFRITRELVASTIADWTWTLPPWLQLRRRSSELACCDLSPFPVAWHQCRP